MFPQAYIRPSYCILVNPFAHLPFVSKNAIEQLVSNVLLSVSFEAVPLAGSPPLTSLTLSRTAFAFCAIASVCARPTNMHIHYIRMVADKMIMNSRNREPLFDDFLAAPVSGLSLSYDISQ